MRILKWGLIAIACFLGGAGLQAVADYAVTQGSGTTFFAFTSSGKQVPAHVVVNSSSTEVGTSGAPFRVDPTGGTTQPVSGTVTANQGTANATPWLVTGTGGTFPVSGTLAATQSGTWTVTGAGGTFPITAASGSISSGAVASGAVASGAFAAGSIASGAMAAGAMVDFLTTRQTMAAGTAATNSQAAGGQYNSTPITLTNTQGSALQLDANGYLKVNTAAGAAAGGTSSNFGSGFPTPGTAVGFSDGTNMVAAKVGAVANVAAATNMLNTLPSCNYNATPLTVTDTRYQSVQCDVNGFLKVNVTNANANGQATMANSSPIVIASNQTANALWGHGATAATVPANATMAGARAQNAEATAVTNGQLASLATDLVGKLITLPYANPENFVQGVTASITDTTTTSIIASAGGSLRNYLTSCKVTNSHATVGTYVNILDGSTVIDSGFAAPVGGGWVSTYGAPLKGTAATAVNCKAETTGASFKCQCNGYKGL